MATNSPNLIPLPSARLEPGVAYAANDSQIAAAMAQAQANLLRQQKPDGQWCGELFVDSTLCSDYVLYLHWLGEVDREIQDRCTQHILRRQLADGGWNIYYGGPSEINASVKAYFALKLAGYSADLPFMREARANILRMGGIPRVNTFSKLYLALMGQFPWKYLPTIPVEMVLLPEWAPFHIYKMSSWSRAMLMPLAIINHFKPTRELSGEKQLHELYPLGTEHKDFRLPRDERVFTWRNLFLRADDALKMLHRIPWKPLRRIALEEAERWMIERIGEGSDGLAAVYPAMLNALIALHALGYPNSHPALIKAKKDFEGLFVNDPEDFRIQPCLSPVWDTAINVIALAESGLPPEHPALQKAAAWLSSKEVRIRGDWTKNNSHPEASGWAFEYNNVYYPDTDDTAMVLMALRLVRPEDDKQYEEVFERALAWQLSFQCRDGGWGAFDKDVIDGWLENMPFADHNAILDPTCSDLTARTLELFGYIDFDRFDPSVKEALRYLIRTQEDDGSWYGRWGVNYIYGTWQVLRGLRAIGQDMTQDWILRGRDWLESCQNDDGGWGETCATYEDPSAKGKGDSGLRYLLSTQQPDGSWHEPQITGTGFPGVFYLKYDMYRQNFPLLALATYVNYKRSFGHPRSFFRCG
ncbi:MAG: squalene--hopene cyclase [Verrucomicrobia bacterium]|nr:MAG: squalene--hopene cyclase [Verrucomicrobiota bacterium]